MKTPLLSLLCIIFLIPQGFTQQRLLDSLENSLSLKSSPTEKADLLNQLAWQYQFQNTKKAREFAEKALADSENSEYVKGWSSACNTLGLISIDEGNPRKAIDFFDKGMDGKKRLLDEKGLASITSNKGIALVRIGDYPAAVQCYVSALQIREKLGDERGIADCHNQLGLLNRDKGNYPESNHHFQQALSIRKKIKDQRGIAYACNNLASNASDEGNYLLSISLYQEAIPILEELKDLRSLATCLCNLGLSNQRLKNSSMAMQYYEEGLALAVKTGNEAAELDIQNGIGDMYLWKKEISQAKTAYQMAAKLAEKLSEKGDLSHALSGIGRCLEEENKTAEASSFFRDAQNQARASGQVRNLLIISHQRADFLQKHDSLEVARTILKETIPLAKENKLKSYLQEAYRIAGEIQRKEIISSRKGGDSLNYYKEYAQVRDSIFKKDLTEKLASEQVHFQTQRKDAEIIRMKQEKQIAALEISAQNLEIQKRNLGLGLGLLVLSLLGLSLWLNNKKSRLEISKAAILAGEAERRRISRDIHDDLGSGLSRIRLIAHKASASAMREDPAWNGILETSESLMDNMRELLWVMDSGQTSLLSLAEKIREFSRDYLQEFQIELMGPDDPEFPELKLNRFKSREIYLIAKESIHNIARHSGAENASLSFYCNSEFCMEITDNGRGIGITGSNGRGMENIRSRAKELGGKIELSSSESGGLSLLLKIPLHYLNESA